MLVLRWILLPVSLIYQLIVWVRNLCYDKGIFQSRVFHIPTIVIGNLAVGGTGKSPMTEYLVRLLAQKYVVATLSRGYGRKSKGFRIVETCATAAEVGDEPLQFKKKFPNITVAVAEDRCTGVEKLMHNHDLIILDDAYQHRKLKGGYNILLFDYYSLFHTTLTLPTGPFRDNFSASKRADLIVVTKCPPLVSIANKNHIEHRIRKYSTSPIFYTTIQYSSPRDFTGMDIETDLSTYDVLLVTGIANPKPLRDYLLPKVSSLQELHFADHHHYKVDDYVRIRANFNAIQSPQKIIITTEKDMQRLDRLKLLEIPLYYIPIQLKSEDQQRETFDHFVLNYLFQHFNVNKH